MIIKNNSIRIFISPLIYLLIFFTLFDNYLFEIFNFKTKLDEFILLILNIIFIISFSNKIFIKNKLYSIELLLVFLSLILFTSSLLNYSTGIIQKALGSYYLIKSLNVFFLVYTFGITKKYTKKILNLIIYIAIFSVFIQLIQFILPNINSLSMNLIPKPYVTDHFIRCPGILGAPNRTAQLFVIAYIFNRLLGKSIFNYRTFIFIAGLLLASSNLTLFTFLLVITMDILKNNKKLIFPLVLVIFLGLIYFGNSFLFRLNQLYELAYVNESYFRLFAFLNSLEILGNNLFLGVGPGMYGGSVSAVLGTPIYEQYNTFSYYGNSLHIPTTIDMFWPHFWAEVGILGLIIFLNIFLKIFKINNQLKYEKSYFLNLLLFSLLFFGISTFAVESIFSSVIIYSIIASYMYWSKQNVFF